jgi:hypothetical protein
MEPESGSGDAPSVLESRVPWGEHPRFKLATGLAGIVSLVLAALYLFTPTWFPTKPSGPSSPVTATTEADAANTSPDPSKSPVRPPTIAVGSCLTDDGSLVACSAQHRSEVIKVPGDSCGQDDLVRYLSGVPGIDVMVTSPKIIAEGVASGYCVVDLPVGVSDVMVWQGHLPDGRSADAWRRCFDADTDDDRIPCSLTHTGEYMGLKPGVADCAVSFEQYARIRFEEVSDHLSLSRVQIPSESSQSCLARVLGGDKLSQSIRDLRTRTLPLIPE